MFIKPMAKTVKSVKYYIYLHLESITTDKEPRRTDSTTVTAIDSAAATAINEHEKQDQCKQNNESCNSVEPEFVTINSKCVSDGRIEIFHLNPAKIINK